MDDAVVSLEVLARSRKPLAPGDIFVCRPSGRGYLFGRVVATDARIKSMENCILAYVFSQESESADVPDRLSAMRLLVPPFMTNRLPWSRGYFRSLGNRAFEPGERLPHHCFEEPLRRPIRFWDEYNHELPSKREPCGIYALNSYRTIDSAINAALSTR